MKNESMKVKMNEGSALYYSYFYKIIILMIVHFYIFNKLHENRIIKMNKCEVKWIIKSENIREYKIWDPPNPLLLSTILLFSY